MEPGQYAAKATEVKLGRAGTGTYQIGVSFQLVDGGNITWYGALTEAAMELTIKALRACGWQGDDISEITAESLPNEVQLDIQRDDRGRLKVQWVNTPGIAMKDVLGKDEAKAFAQGLKARIAAIKAGAPSPAKKAADPSDKVPF